MKITRQISEEIEIKTVEIEILFDEIADHQPTISPLIVISFYARNRTNSSYEVWRIGVEIDTGKITGWPTDGPAVDLYVKACDTGSYRLLGPDNRILAAIEQNYVPNGCIPGVFGDYIDLQIAADGTITNWPKNPNVAQFFGTKE